MWALSHTDSLGSRLTVYALPVAGAQGGKSTLLRTCCAAVILAQIGCLVPAASCVLSVTDAIYTRIGATDRIITGESTFMVECNECAAILKNATESSLVVFDELGRGTSTFDGYAIAHAVLAYMVGHVGCRMLFATHYHPLNQDFAHDPRVQQAHMSARCVA
jgi:DNA mismatch repair protein MSH6